jgi:hypothetical protein
MRFSFCLMIDDVREQDLRLRASCEFQLEVMGSGRTPLMHHCCSRLSVRFPSGTPIWTSELRSQILSACCLFEEQGILSTKAHFKLQPAFDPTGEDPSNNADI